MKIIKKYDAGKETNRIKKTIQRRRQKSQEQVELSSRLDELKSTKTDIRNKIDALNQIISHTEEAKDQIKIKIKQLKKKIRNLPSKSSV